MASNKNIFGFRFFSLLFALLAIVGWVASTFYIAEQTEHNIRASLEQQKNNSSSPFYLDLVSYQRSLFAAHLVARLRSNNSGLNKIINGFVLRADIKHGPLVFNERNLQLATASMNMSIEQSQLSEEAEDLLPRLFGDKKLFSGNVLVDYDLRRHYQFASTPFEYEVADMIFSVSAGSAKGVYELGAEGVSVNFNLDEIVFKQGEDSMESMKNQFVFSLFNGSKTTAERFTSTVMMTEGANYTGLSFDLADLQLDKITDLINTYEDRYNLDQQIKWTLEDAAQTQEGQDRLFELFLEQDEEALPESTLIVNQLLKQGVDDISYLHKIDNQNMSLAYNQSVE